MLCAYERFTGVSYKGFRASDKDIAALYKELYAVSKVVGKLPEHLCRMAGIDVDYYCYWIETNSLTDLAELIVLYLTDDERRIILAKLKECKEVCCS